MIGVKEIPLDLACLSQMTAVELQMAWRNHFGGTPPSDLSKSLFARLLVYRMQVQSSGDLSRTATRFFHGIAEDLKASKDAEVHSGQVRHSPADILSLL